MADIFVIALLKAFVKLINRFKQKITTGNGFKIILKGKRRENILF